MHGRPWCLTLTTPASIYVESSARSVRPGLKSWQWQLPMQYWFTQQHMHSSTPHHSTTTATAPSRSSKHTNPNNTQRSHAQFSLRQQPCTAFYDRLIAIRNTAEQVLFPLAYSETQWTRKSRRRRVLTWYAAVRHSVSCRASQALTVDWV